MPRSSARMKTTLGRGGASARRVANGVSRAARAKARAARWVRFMKALRILKPQAFPERHGMNAGAVFGSGLLLGHLDFQDSRFRYCLHFGVRILQPLLQHADGRSGTRAHRADGFDA